MPPPAEGLAARIVLGPALRTQPDRRLVALVRDGYETAFEEIVRRYGAPLRRYAAAIVGGRSEDVTQDAFSKALLALRRDGAEIELRPWLFRIVRNTALNDLRDRPPSAEVLAEALAGGRNPAEEMERREEMAELIRRLQTLPEPQRAAIVMRELEGLGHEEIAAALGLSGGGARQAIYRARQALRDGFGALLPVPVLRALLSGSSAAPVELAAGAAGAGGAGVALKAATVTVLVAGALGAGVAVDDGHRNESRASADAGSAGTGNPSRAAADSMRPRPTAAGASDREADSEGPSGGGGTSRQTNSIERDEGHSGRGASQAPTSGSGNGDRGGKDAAEQGLEGGGGSSGKGGGQGSDDSVSGPSGPGGDSGDDGGGGGGGGGNSGPGSGATVPTMDGETATSDRQDSNSGPDSGDGSATQQSGTDDLRDPDGASVFSVQETQP
jgi:RNA polymerase sigma factor (sigma-70 family)